MATTENRMLKDDDGEKPRRKPGRPKKTEEEKKQAAAGIACDKCGSDNHYVYSTRPHQGGRRRYRACRNCGNYFITEERPAPPKS